MTNTNKENSCQPQGKKVITSGSLPYKEMTDLLAAALLHYIWQEEQDRKREKGKSA